MSTGLSKTFLALANEAGLASEHIAVGTAALGKANYAQQAYYSQCFFALSVGFERACKLALVVNHAIQHRGAFPGEAVVKSYQHNLRRLLEEVDQIAVRHIQGDDWARLPRHAVNDGIIATLTEFASNVTRYYNLQVATGGLFPAGIASPVAAWFERVTKPVLQTHDTEDRRVRREAKAREMEELFGSLTMVRHHDETGGEITSLEDAARQSGITEFTRPYERMYLLQIARFLATVLSELGYAAMAHGADDIPAFSEFFGHFRNDDAYFRRRQTWSMYGR